MIKAQFTRERLDGFGLAAGFEFVKVKVPHPYGRGVCPQPTFAMTIRIAVWQFYFMVYRPANFSLTRKERRANKFH